MTEQCEQIEQKIDETKASLVGKLEALETQVAEAVQSTTETVSGTVDAVKETVDTVKEKVRSAGQFFDLNRQARNNPWMVFGCSVAAGCVASYLLGPSSAKAAPPSADSRTQPCAAQPEKKHSWLREQLVNLSGLAVGSLMGVVRDLAARSLPETLGQSVSQEVDRFNARVGGKPVGSSPKQPAI